MTPKVQEKERVLALRRKGYSYREILQEVPVSKSSVSLWLKDSPLTEKEKRLLRDRKQKDISRWKLRAATSLRQARKERDDVLFKESQVLFKKNINNPLFQMGIGLYWAEGSKRSSSFGFTNSDVDMVVLMLKWMQLFLVSSEEEIGIRVYTHRSFADERHEEFWSEQTGVPLTRFKKTIYKSQKGIITKKRPNYKGCVRLEVGKVSYLRKLLFWQQMLIEYYKKER